MSFFCRFAVWCYLPRFVRRLCSNGSSKSFGKLCWTPLREQLFYLHWMTRVWVWSIISLFLTLLLFYLSACPPPPSSSPPVSLSLSVSLPYPSICSALSYFSMRYKWLNRKWNMASLKSSHTWSEQLVLLLKLGWHLSSPERFRFVVCGYIFHIYSLVQTIQKIFSF